jgi:hypothetical protein
MTATIERSADGTLVHRGTPADSTTVDVLKANGIRWSRRIETSCLPRTLRPENRDAKVRAVTRAVGHAIGLEETDGRSCQSAHNGHAGEPRPSAQIDAAILRPATGETEACAGIG